MEALKGFFSALWSAILALAVSLGLGSGPERAPLQGYVEGEFVLVSPLIGGTLETLSVARGDHVSKGQHLFGLDDSDEIAAHDRAAALVKEAENRRDNLAKGKRRPELDMIRAQKAQAEAEANLARLHLQRQERLKSSPAFTQERLDQAVAEYKRDLARVAELEAELETALMTMGRDDELRAAESEVAASRAALAQALWRLEQKTVFAPASGLVTDTYFDPGEGVLAGQPVVSILPRDKIKVRFFVPEESLARVAVGAPVTISCDGCGEDIAATIRFVSPEAEYTPPVLYNRENRNRLVFMVEATPEVATWSLRPGQPVDVELGEP